MVKLSTIDNSGFGVFSVRMFGKSETVGLY